MSVRDIKNSSVNTVSLQNNKGDIYANGRAVQVDPIKPALKAPGTKRLTLK
jgi:hypothetical protein